MKEQEQWLNICIYVLVNVVTNYYGVFSILSSSFLQEVSDGGVDGEDKEINIEINSITNNYLRRRNAAYIFKRYSDSINVGSSYKKMTNFIQINLTANLSYEYPDICKYVMYDKINNLTYIDNLSISSMIFAQLSIGEST